MSENAPALTANDVNRPQSDVKTDHAQETKTVVERKDNVREIIETVVFVAILVLLLKSFVAEAFVIPTGSMAETLWGYQKVVHCPRCGWQFPVNCANEVEPHQNGDRGPVTACTCPNCRYHVELKADCDSAGAGKEHIRATGRKWVPGEWVGATAQITSGTGAGQMRQVISSTENDLAVDPPWEIVPEGRTSFVLDKHVPWTTGDRVLVAKFLYDLDIVAPSRHDVVVFKFPRQPQRNHVAMNYIKRLIGLPGETVAIWYGDVFVARDIEYPGLDEPRDVEQMREAVFKNDPRAIEMLRNGKEFEIVRKEPAEMLSMRRIVNDNDFQYKDQLQRWQGGKWESTDHKAFQHKGADGEETAWLRYSHLVNGSNQQELITDLLGYNTGREGKDSATQGVNWVGDLMLECDVDVEQPKGELILELTRSESRFRAVFDLATGKCRLVRLWNGKEEELADKPTAMYKPGRYRVRFANFDQRLTVWVDKELPFGNGIDYLSTRERGPTEEDLKPAAIGVRGSDVKVEKIQLWRDTYYTTGHGMPGSPDASHIDAESIWKDPTKWDSLRNLEPRTFYVQPDHYLCLGDNSQQSSDARDWGLVPRRLLLGRALYVYYPFHFPYWPLHTPVGRTGPIR